MYQILTAIAILISFTPEGAAPLDVEVLSEIPAEFHDTGMMVPRPDSARYHRDGSVTMFVSRVYEGNETDLYPIRWTVELDGITAVTSLEAPDERPVVRFSYSGYGGSQVMSVMNHTGDTLWTASLEGTDDFDNCLKAYILGNGDFLIVSNPDCWATSAYLARISADGEPLWREYLSTVYLLDIAEGVAEIYPHVESVRETADGGILLCGSVQQWVTDPDAMFVTLLDGSTGEPVWRTTHNLEGQAAAFDMAVTSSGRIAVVGKTSETAHPEGNHNAAIWSEHTLPFIGLLSLRGDILGIEVIENTSAEQFTGVVSPERGETELMVLGKTPSGILLLRADADLPD